MAAFSGQPLKPRHNPHPPDHLFANCPDLSVELLGPHRPLPRHSGWILLKRFIPFALLFLCFCNKPITPLFLHSNLEDALDEAAKQNKFVFIDFRAEWCGPCRNLEKTTWKDEAVGNWLKEHAVTVMIDTDEQPELAAQFDVEEIPNLVFLDSKGNLLDRFAGYKNAADFLSWAETVIKAGDAETRLAKKEAAAGDDLFEMSQLAKEYVDLKNPEKVFSLLKKVWERAEQQPEAMPYIFRDTAAQLAHLGEGHPPARLYIEDKLSALKATALTTENDEETWEILKILAEAEPEKEVGEFIAKLLKKRGKSDTSSQIAAFYFDNLVLAQAYLLIDRHIDLETFTKKQWVTYQLPEVGMPTNLEDELRQDFAEFTKFKAQQRLSAVYETHKALGNPREAQRVADMILNNEYHYEHLNNLAWAGYSSGKADDTDLAMAEKAFALTEGLDFYVTDTYFRLLCKLDHKEKAKELATYAEQTFEHVEYQTLMETWDSLLKKD